MTNTRHRRCLWLVCLWILLGGAPGSWAEVKLIVPTGYLSGAPFPIRVEVRDSSGERDWNLWNAEASLTTDQPGVTLSTSRILLRNGLGTALLTINGSPDFALTAIVNGESHTRRIASLNGRPGNSVSGTLTGASTTWSGVINLAGTVIVPNGHVLTLEPSTLVLISGVASGTSGVSLIVNGAVRSLGTEANPITITCSSPNLNWGQIRHENAQASTYQYTFISKAGRAPGEGHTGTGPALRVRNSTLTLENCVVSDLTAGGSTIGKTMQAAGSNLSVRDCVMARSRMGPEIGGTGLVCTDSYFMDMTGPDDADGIYLHSSAGRPLALSGCVFASGDDDAVDTLDSNVTLENCLIRDWPNPNEDAKGVSVFHGEVVLRRCLIGNCFAGVSAKSSGPLAVVRIDHCTIVGIDHGVSAATKSNAAAGNINIYMTNSIVRAADALRSDFGPEKFVSVSYCNLSETWPGAGNLTADPLFLNPSAGDYRPQPSSPSIDAGDPNSPLDPDGSRTDLGFYTARSQAGGLFVSITSPAAGAIFAAPTNLTITASAFSGTGTVARVEFFEATRKLGEDLTGPYSLLWNNVGVGNYTLRALATQSGGLMVTSAPVSISVTSGEGPSTNILVAAGSEWKYLDNGSDEGTAWRQLAFDDSSWKTGKAQLGYGDGDEATVLGFGASANNKYVTYYFRKTFALEDASRVRSLSLNLLRDDGAIVYLNGQEVRRVSMPAGAVGYRTFATTASEYSWESSPLAGTLLTAGTNLVAVEVHQGNATSSDLSFDLELAAVFSAPTNARPIVVLTSPADATVFGAPANLLITANAADVDGAVSNVTFYANGAKLGEDPAAPYAFAWSSVPPGNYAITAVATDATGLSATSGVVSITVSAETGAPTVVAQSPPPGVVTNLTEIKVTFSKSVTHVDAADLLLNGVPATKAVGSGASYTFSFAQPAPGTVTVSWSLSHGITDTFQPPSGFDAGGAGAVWQYEFIDAAPPVLAQVGPEPRETLAALSKIQVTFNETVTGVDAADLLINSSPAIGLSGLGAGPYVFDFPQPGPGTVAVAWAESHGIRDLANNPFGGGSWAYVLDTNQVGIVINEIMYHPASENPLEEYIELFNRGASSINLRGWRISDGVEFTFPDVSIPAGGSLVVAADLAAFRSKYPAVTNVVGGWTGILSNSSEDLDLDDPFGNRVDSVRYADNGDWAVRQRGPLDRGHRGWVWSADHDGFGKSLELINPAVSNNNGQNWAASSTAEGTPGRVNSIFRSDTAPLIQSVAHFPIVPKSNESIRFTAEVRDEPGAAVTVTLHHRLDSATPPPFAVVPMRDDGSNGDVSAGDGVFSAILPPQANNAVVEFYVTATDASGAARTWPAPATAAADGTGPSGQVVNVLLQVDDTAYTGGRPLYKLIMTENERAELAVIPSQSNAEGPNSQMNATFISIDGTGTNLRYLVGVRNRGHGTRTANPPNYRVNFRSDHPWKGVTALNLNTRQVHMQHFGSVLANKSGAVGTYSRAVRVRVNNENRAAPGAGMFGSYAANEVYESAWADRHFPSDSAGNIYKVARDIRPPNFDYRGPGWNSYTNTYFKETNVSENDWTDLIAMLRIMGEKSGDSFATENVRQVINVEQWLTHLAVMNLLANGESGLNTGNNDDYYLYRGWVDRRFILLFHDLDQILGQPGSLAQNVDLFRATCCPISGDSEGAWRAMTRFLHWPDFERLYFATLQRLLDSTFSKSQFDALIDQTLGSYVPQATIDSVKTWMDGRRAFVRSQLPPIVTNPAPVATVTGAPRSPTPQLGATLAVGGFEITHYRYSLNSGPYGLETPVGSVIQVAGLANGTNTIAVIGRNAAGAWQVQSNATVLTWIVNTSWPLVRINEVLAWNVAAVNRNGSFPDVIELYNEGAATVNLSGFSLTDDPARPSKYTFPNGTTLDGGAYLVLDANQLGFALDHQGDGVFLFHRLAEGGALLDSVEFGTQLSDLSIGRLSSGGEWMLMQATFGAANVVQPLGDAEQVRINEWLTFGLSPYPEDFVELFNPQPLPVALGGCYLTDQPVGAPTRSRLAPLTFAPPRGYAVFTSGDGDRAGEINFRLAAEQGELSLIAPDLSLIDSVVYGPQTTGVSIGRCPDGVSKQVPLSTPTPGGPNQCSLGPPPTQTVTLVAFTNVWRYDASGTDLGTLWKELAYDDSAWRAGPGVLGFETAQLPEPLLTPFANPGSVATFYFRTTFDVPAFLSPSSLQITHVIDDGAAFYLNGVEIGARFNLPTAANFQTFASGTVGDAGYQTFTISPDRLRPGTNRLAVEVHQVNRTSSDMVFGLKLEALVLTNSAAQAGIVINEVLANNATLVESDGGKPDWIELYNPSGSTVDLAGMSLSDDLTNPRRWIFPSGSLLPAKGFLKVRCSPEAPASVVNTGFGLNAASGGVFLFNRPADGNGLQSALTYGLQAADWSLGRVPDGSTNWVLNIPTFGMENRAATLGGLQFLKINEWMAAPVSGEDWLEIYNPNPQPVEISSLALSDNATDAKKHILPPLSFIGSGAFGFQSFVADENLDAGADHVDFKLSGSGESLVISAPSGALIDAVSFGPQVAGVSEGRLPDGGAYLAGFPSSLTPGSSNFRRLEEIVINELLSHSDPPLEDTVELHNPGGRPVDIGGWFLSDSVINLRKYQIPANTMVPAGGYLVIYEAQFNGDAASERFSFSSARGDEVYLSQAVNGVLTGYRASAAFGPAENGVSFGRFPTSQGYRFVPMLRRTFGKDEPASTNEFRLGTGAPNAPAKVGPIVLSEIMYHPAGTNDALEFVELHNISSGAVPLYDPANPNNTWRLRKGIDFDFPPGVTMPAGGQLVVVGFDPRFESEALAGFQRAYGNTATLLGPYRGKLDNAGDTIELQKPDAPQTLPGPDFGLVPYLVADRIDYADTAPWPASADGAGHSLQKTNDLLYGNDPVNWIAASPTPGGSPASSGDSDRDGLPDDWELANRLNPKDPSDALADSDGDGLTNLQEYLAGTNPTNAGSVLKATVQIKSGSELVLQFNAAADRAYSIEFRDSLAAEIWQKLTDVSATPSERVVQLPIVPGSSARFFRVVSQRAP
ncbi:MAG: lamin tail domain-containing protein [Verrucomicrobia bacterium]|nr:lamin tail domain-containing protein [Verrucomicrobiota bacterium]